MRLTVNGLDTEITYDRNAIEDVLGPWLQEWVSATQDGRRHVAFLVAPPGAGKSTLALLLERHLDAAVQSLGIDGFHLPQSVLDAATITRDGERVRLCSIKGTPESFDVAGLDAMLTRLLDPKSGEVRWPIYDRRAHDVSPDGPTVTSTHLLLEGNWLLLADESWRALRRHADRIAFIEAPEALLRGRLVGRKVAGGLSQEAAEAFFNASDGPNVRRVLTESDSNDADLRLSMGEDGLLTESQDS